MVQGTTQFNTFTNFHISIHHMFWFKPSSLKTSVSQPYFNTSYVLVQAPRILLYKTLNIFQYIICFGSSVYNLNCHISKPLFQYIICFGSRKLICIGSPFLVDFNTSYVLVQGRWGNKSCSTKQISIHHMFWFKFTFGINILPNPIFQYIICFGSRNTQNRRTTKLSLFQYIICFGSRQLLNLKTVVLKYFNTSYVLVQVSYPARIAPFAKFQYIICFGSRSLIIVFPFITNLFQYIICFGSSH